MPKKKNVQSPGNASPETKVKGGTRKEDAWEPVPPKQDPQPYDRSITLSESEKEEIMEELKAHYNYDWFIDENPDVQERITRGKKESRKEGLKEGEVKGL